jgi:uncharacterized protein YyaL (SSP411 family)
LAVLLAKRLKASEALIRLYEADGDETWLDRAQQNIDVLHAQLVDSATHGCWATCNPDGTQVSSVQQEVDQAWMQRAQALLAKYR